MAFEEFKHKVDSKYLKKGDRCFRMDAQKVMGNMMERINHPFDGDYPWFRFVRNRDVGWLFDKVLTDHPVYSEGWENLGDGTRKTKLFLVSEEIQEESNANSE